MYSLNIPVSALRTKMRQEFERHRYVTQLEVVDVLLAQSNSEYQVCGSDFFLPESDLGSGILNSLRTYWSGMACVAICGTRTQHRLQEQCGVIADDGKETLNYWKQLPHILKYFRAEEDPTARLPQNFMSGFLEVRYPSPISRNYSLLISIQGA